MPENRESLPADPARPTQPHAPAIGSPVLSRVVGVFRGFTGLAGMVTVVVLAAEAVLPASYTPSMLIGGFHGRIEAADAEAKGEAVAAFTRRNAEAASQPPAFAGMENDAFRQQQQILAGALQAQSSVANGADVACVAGQLIPRGDRDFGWLSDLLRGACGVGDQVRQNMVDTLRRGGQDGSVLMQRPRAGTEAR